MPGFAHLTREASELAWALEGGSSYRLTAAGRPAGHSWLCRRLVLAAGRRGSPGTRALLFTWWRAPNVHMSWSPTTALRRRAAQRVATSRKP